MYVRSNNIKLSPNRRHNFISYNSIDYECKTLSDDYENSKGGNSSVFRFINSQEDIEYIIKISKYDLNRNRYNISRILRFEREIEALKLTYRNGCSNIIRCYFDDSVQIGQRKFRYYVMEKADFDLMSYLDQNEITVQQRFLLCDQILSGIKELHNLGIYHRDIKPDNVLFINNTWKIGDLGLIANREEDTQIDTLGEKIGPFGWLSPEAMNKYLNEGEQRSNTHNHDCEIDDKSDIFQLGKLFWFIFQGNVPIGQIKSDDFKIDDNEIYDIIYHMLSHSKSRPTLDEIRSSFYSRYQYYGL